MEHTHHNPSCFYHLKGKKMVIQEKVQLEFHLEQHQDVFKEKFSFAKRTMENFIKERIFD